MVDPDRVRQLLDALSDYRRGLGELAELPAERYGGRDAIAGRYLVQVSAQTCIDLANHVISSSGWRVPRDYADAFTVLEQKAILDAGLRSDSGLSPACGTCSCTPTATWMIRSSTPRFARTSMTSTPSRGQ